MKSTENTTKIFLHHFLTSFTKKAAHILLNPCVETAAHLMHKLSQDRHERKDTCNFHEQKDNIQDSAKTFINSKRGGGEQSGGASGLKQLGSTGIAKCRSISVVSTPRS